MKKILSCCLAMCAVLTLTACSGSSSEGEVKAAQMEGGYAPKSISADTTLTPPSSMEGVIILHADQMAYFTNDPGDLEHAYQGRFEYIKTGANTAKLRMTNMSCEAFVSFSACEVAMDLDLVFKSETSVEVTGNQMLIGTYQGDVNHTGTHTDTDGTMAPNGAANHLENVLHTQGGKRTLDHIPFTIQ